MSEWYPCPICGVTHENLTACPPPSIQEPDEEKPMTPDTTRKEFEEWISSHINPRQTEKFPDGEYVFTGMKLAYEAYLEGKKKSEDTKRLELLIEEVKTYSNQSADFMEGEGMPQFAIYEDQMMWGVRTLEKVGIKYDPCTGVSAAIATNQTKD